MNNLHRNLAPISDAAFSSSARKTWIERLRGRRSLRIVSSSASYS